ncbi:MAG TPA: hypothetical protein VK992_01615, partial [Candidatus Caenarcaniphilales bacterium]|nr:hypothetical protein [Candidatus Caenarcaniphilales bacterium]
YDDEMPLVARLAFGAVSGLGVVALLAFVVANAAGMHVAVVSAAAIALAGIGIARRRSVRDALFDDVTALERSLRDSLLAPRLATTGPLVYAVGLVALVWLAFERVVVVEPGAISTGYVNNLGDLPFHMHISASFAYSANFPPMDPTFAGTGFAYPYLADFLSAMFLVLGAPMDGAFFLLNVVLGLALVAIVHRFAYLLTGDRLAALIAPALVLLSGGLGWIVMLDQLRASEQGVVAFLKALPQDYTIAGGGPYRWGNALTTLLTTQRSMLFGIPLTLMIFSLLWRLIHSTPVAVSRLSAGRVVEAVRRRPGAVVAGLLTGLLPLVHAHSFVVVMGTAFLLGVLFRQWRDGRWLPWAVYVVASLAVAVPQIWWSTRNSIANASTFFGLELGWDRGDLDPLTFWLLNTGLFIPLILLGLAVPKLRQRMPTGLVLFSLPFLVWFVVPNLVKLAPWVWDNIKVLFYWYVGFVPLVALLIAWLLRERLALRVAGAAILLALTLTGSIDIWRVISRQTLFTEFDGDGVALADRILADTPARSTVLHAPTWNTPVFLTGRQSLLGYPGHMWSRGLDYAPREGDIRQIYAGVPEAPLLLASHDVEYVVVGPLERNYGPVNDEFFSQFREVAAAGEYRLYEIAAP